MGFVSGCSRLVLLAGTTYLTRLWCIAEVFTFVHMGGDIASIDVVPVLRPTSPDADLGAVRDSFATFDVTKCVCHLVEDKERMLSMIELAFGQLHRFDHVVQDIIRVASRHLIHWRLSQSKALLNLGDSLPDESPSGGPLGLEETVLEASLAARSASTERSDAESESEN